MAVSVLRAIVDIELDLDRDVSQVLGRLCGLLTDTYQYWGENVSQMRRTTVVGDDSFRKPRKSVED